MIPTIQLRSGKFFDYEYPDMSQIDIDDVAHALSNLCRYSGHCSKFYSIAEHSVYASYIPVKLEDQFTALFHDAAESVLLDVVKPLKNILPDYQQIEKRIEPLFAERFGYEYPLPSIVKHADLVMLNIEQRQLFDTYVPWSTELDHKHHVEIAGLSPPIAKKLFLDRYEDLLTQKGIHVN